VVQLLGRARTWDDLQVNFTALTGPVSGRPTWRTYNFGISGGVTFNVLGYAVGDYQDFLIQTPHKMPLRDILDNHMHWIVPTSAPGSKFQIQLDAIVAGIGDTFRVVNGSPFTKEVTLDGSENDTHMYTDVAGMFGENTTVSTMYVCKIQRVAASASEYAGEVYLLYGDGHHKVDGFGSLLEGSK
jgi:hypothetical protein